MAPRDPNFYNRVRVPFKGVYTGFSIGAETITNTIMRASWKPVERNLGLKPLARNPTRSLEP